MLKKHLSSAVTLLTVIACARPLFAADPELAPAFSHPERIRYDNRSLIIDGKPTFIYSGSMHYFRCPKELWKDRLQKIKDAGLNCVETYIAWNVHEPTEPTGPDDFSKLQNMQDIGDFIQTAQDVGLYVSIRPGPYICAEWDRGGFPEWLLKHRPIDTPPHQFLRGNSSEMLAWDKHWITAVAKIVKPHLITNLPPGTPGVINWQLENEYDLNGVNLPANVRSDVLHALAHDALDNGIDVPLYTCLTKEKIFREDPFLRAHVYETINKYPGFNMKSLTDNIESSALYQPEALRAISELQGGWFAQVGGKLSDQQGHNAAQINQLTLAAIEHGVTSMNYYMFYGGSNFGYGAAENLIQSYDYNAPIRETGAIGSRYLAVKAIADMLKEHGDQLIHSDPASITITGEHPDVSITLRHSADGSQFLFFRNSKQDQPRTGTITIQAGNTQIPLTYALDNFGAKILYLPPTTTDPAKGQWLPIPIVLPVSPTTLPTAIPLTIASMAPDKTTDHWLDLPNGKPLSALNIFDQRYVNYRLSFDLSPEEIKNPQALRIRSVGGGGGSTTAIINNTELSSPTQIIPLPVPDRQGHVTAEILFENHGSANGGSGIEEEQGITTVSLIRLAAQASTIPNWRMKIITGSLNKRPEIAADFDDHDWKNVAIDSDKPTISTPKTDAIFRATLDITKAQLAPDAGVTITFGCIDDSATLYVNGQRAGAANSWQHPWSFDITSQLHEGKNSLAMVVRNTDGSGGLYNNCTIDPVGRPLTHLQVALETQSMTNHWEKTLGPIADFSPRRSLCWYTFQFKTPATLAYPWLLHLDADANGFLFFNGHNLGRYWAIGPQRDFWLPECWFNTDPTKPNIIAFQLHATIDALSPAAIIKSAELRPSPLFKD